MTKRIGPLKAICQAVVTSRPGAHEVLADYLRERSGRFEPLTAELADLVGELINTIPALLNHLLACAFAETVLPYWEARFPMDRRPRQAIECKRAWVRGYSDPSTLDAAWWAAAGATREWWWCRDPAYCAAWRAADRNPTSAAWEAAWHASRLCSWSDLLLVAADALDEVGF
jgi:hypothetical protein